LYGKDGKERGILPRLTGEIQRKLKKLASIEANPERNYGLFMTSYLVYQERVEYLLQTTRAPMTQVIYEKVGIMIMIPRVQ